MQERFIIIEGTSIIPQERKFASIRTVIEQGKPIWERYSFALHGAQEDIPKDRLDYVDVGKQGKQLMVITRYEAWSNKDRYEMEAPLRAFTSRAETVTIGDTTIHFVVRNGWQAEDGYTYPVYQRDGETYAIMDLYGFLSDWVAGKFQKVQL